MTFSMHHESPMTRRICAIGAFAVVIGFFILVQKFFAPAPGMPGVDENAYLVGARNILHHGSPGFKPETPFSFVGPMWILAKDGWYYPKYPFGVPLLDATAMWVTHHDTAAFWVSPICATLAVAAMFLLGRMVVGSFLALLGTLILATNQTLLQLALDPSSHAPALCLALWGFFALFAWWRSDKTWIGCIAGALLGLSVAMRYSEGLLVIPLAVVAAMTIEPRNWRSWVAAALPMMVWTIPVALLMVFNHTTTGHWTGYGATGESTGFTLADFKQKWQTTLQQLDVDGLFFILPLGLLGMFMMWASNWRVGMILSLWFVPETLLYMAYYWGGGQQGGVGYLRFFLTIYPPVILAAMWLINSAATMAGPIGLRVAAGGFATAVAALGLCASWPQLSRQQAFNQRLVSSGRSFLNAVGPIQAAHGNVRPVFFAEDQGPGSDMLMYMQFVGDGEWYSTRSFTSQGARGPMRGPPPQNADGVARPSVMDPQRSAYI
jgi:Dolichyl-phosphate-mannose-protein mannosyltransferase